MSVCLPLHLEQEIAEGRQALSVCLILPYGRVVLSLHALHQPSHPQSRSHELTKKEHHEKNSTALHSPRMRTPMRYGLAVAAALVASSGLIALAVVSTTSQRSLGMRNDRSLLVCTRSLFAYLQVCCHLSCCCCLFM